jgi:HAD superfamily hydrolase (TIGR01549 family)
MRRPGAVLFDWDGTLYDSARLCFEIYEELFKRFGLGRITFLEFRRDFSGDYHRYQEKHGLGPEAWPEFDSAWYEVYYSKQGRARPFGNSFRALGKLKELGVPAGLVTNATRKRIDVELEKLGMRGYFGAVVTIEDADWEFKPSPRMIEIACNALGLSGRDVLYVGDMAEDVQAGKAAGSITGVVATGIHTLERLLQEGPDFVFSDVGEVPGVLG